MILFEQPSFLVLLIFIVPLIYVSHFWKGRGGRILISYKIHKNNHTLKVSYFFIILSGLSHLLWWGSFVLLILSLANPGFVERHKILLKENSAIMILLDVSPSMAAQDSGQIKSRFEIAKDAILRFLPQRDGNPIGLITFGLEAAVRIPLTKDYNFFTKRLEDTWLLEHGDGTNIGMALAVAALQLQRSGVEHKTIILMTDGANNIGEFNPDDAINLLQSLNIKTFTVGIGSRERIHISVWDKKQERFLNGIVDDAYDEELMRAIAVHTGGYFFKSESAAAFDAMFTVVEQQQTQDGLSRISVTTTSIKYIILLSAFCVLLVWFILRYIILREVF